MMKKREFLESQFGPERLFLTTEILHVPWNMESLGNIMICLPYASCTARSGQ